LPFWNQFPFGHSKISTRILAAGSRAIATYLGYIRDNLHLHGSQIDLWPQDKRTIRTIGTIGRWEEFSTGICISVTSVVRGIIILEHGIKIKPAATEKGSENNGTRRVAKGFWVGAGQVSNSHYFKWISIKLQIDRENNWVPSRRFEWFGLCAFSQDEIEKTARTSAKLNKRAACSWSFYCSFLCHFPSDGVVVGGK